MTITINTLDGRSHVTNADEEALNSLLQGMSVHGAVLKINSDRTVQTYIIASTISSVNVSK